MKVVCFNNFPPWEHPGMGASSGHDGSVSVLTSHGPHSSANNDRAPSCRLPLGRYHPPHHGLHYKPQVWAEVQPFSRRAHPRAHCAWHHLVIGCPFLPSTTPCRPLDTSTDAHALSLALPQTRALVHLAPMAEFCSPLFQPSRYLACSW
jgi:hypothetical protein